MLSWLAVALGVVVMAGSGAVFALYRHYDSRIERVQGVVTPRPAAEPETGAMNILLVGSDTRDELSDEELAEIGTERDGGGMNTDTIILVHLAPDVRQATMVSFPRDSYVYVPGWPGRHKINSVYGHAFQAAPAGEGPTAGAKLLAATVADLSGVHIDHYVQVDFKGFISLSNAVGGVDVCLKKAQKDHYSGIDLPAGVTRDLKGAQALAFVRQRQNGLDSDLDRIARQQYFATALSRKLTATGVLLNPVKLNAVLSTATSSLTVDSSFGAAELRSLATKLRHLDPADISARTVPVTTIDGHADGMSVVLLDDTQLAASFADLRLPAPEASDPLLPADSGASPAVSPGSVALTVVNASGTAGVAQTAAGQLAQVGFAVASYGDAVAPPAGSAPPAETVIRYNPALAPAARTVQAALPGAVLRADPSLGRSPVVTIGSGFTSVRALPGAPASPSAPAVPPPASTASAGPQGEAESVDGIPCIN